MSLKIILKNTNPIIKAIKIIDKYQFDANFIPMIANQFE